MSLFRAGDRKGTEALIAFERLPSSVFEWCVTQGMHITGTKTPWDFLVSIEKQLAGWNSAQREAGHPADRRRADHLFDIDWILRTMHELVCARSVTARIFTAREGAEQHCQLGNSAAARTEIVRWLSQFYPGMPGSVA